MSQHHYPDGLFHEVWQLYEGGHNADEIHARLIRRDIPADLAEEVIARVKTMRNARKRRRGLRLSIAGGITLMMAFLVTFILHQCGIETNILLYGLTTAGIGLLFAGMVYYMG